jgi:large subunit ribosomal protein L30
VVAKARKVKTINIKQVKSAIGYPRKQREVLRGLGLRRLNQVVVRNDTPEIRGMVNKIHHLVKIIEE